MRVRVRAREREEKRGERKRECVCVVLEEEARQSLASDGGIQVRGFDWKMVRQRPELTSLKVVR